MIKTRSGYSSVFDFPKEKIDKYSTEITQKIYRYADRWASLIEDGIKAGFKLPSIARETHYRANTESLTYLMREKAVEILEEVWVHGPELRRWYEIQKDR